MLFFLRWMHGKTSTHVWVLNEDGTAWVDENANNTACLHRLLVKLKYKKQHLPFCNVCNSEYRIEYKKLGYRVYVGVCPSVLI